MRPGSPNEGIGGEAQGVGVCELPLGFGGVHGLMETAVVEGDVPLPAHPGEVAEESEVRHQPR